MGLGHKAGCDKPEDAGWTIEREQAHLSILKLLLDIVNESIADFAYKASEKQFWPHFAGTRHGTTNAHQCAYLVCPKIADTRDKGEMIEGDVEFARLQISGVCCGSGGVDLQVFRFEFCYEIEQSATKIREESVVLFLNRIRKNIISLE